MIKRLFMAGVMMACVLLYSGVRAEDPKILVSNANKAYADGMYAQAAELYKKVADDGYASPGLFFNLGNACFKMNDIPSAILWYERARKLSPGDEAINYNLNVANSKISDKIEPVPELFYKRWYTSVLELFSSDAWAWITVVLFLLTCASGVLYVVSRPMFVRKTAFWAAAGLAVLFLLSCQLSWKSYSVLKNTREAIIMTPVVTVKSSPDEKSIDLFVLHEGSKVTLLDRIGKWYEIRIANGSVGWLPDDTMEQI